MARGQPTVPAADASSSSDGDGDDDDHGLSALIGSSFARQAKRQRTLLPDADAASSGEAPGKFAYALHGVTKQPTTGLGARLAGTSNPVDDLWLPASLPWQPADASGSQVLPALLPAAHALRLELRRAARLARLRARFVELCATTSLPSPPVNAFERWRFMCKWQEQGEPSDALLPTGPAQAADASFAADLGRLGVAPAAADLLDMLMVRLVGAPLGADAVAMRDAMPTPEALGGGSRDDGPSKGEGGGNGGAGGGEGGGGGVANFHRVLFDKERDNFYEEPVQQAQLSATLLRSALSRTAAPHAAAAAARWHGTLLARQGAATRDSSAPLLGGGAEAFLWETRIALALWAVAPPEQDPACGAAWPLEDPPLAVAELLGPRDEDVSSFT